ncbi:MAG: hypothetical protein ABII07_02800 [Patescibacteria group bacterium]|nr:hypothetical protein [Patescibacteria group bacterium]
MKNPYENPRDFKYRVARSVFEDILNRREDLMLVRSAELNGREVIAVQVLNFAGKFLPKTAAFRVAIWDDSRIVVQVNFRNPEAQEWGGWRESSIAVDGEKQGSFDLDFEIIKVFWQVCDKPAEGLTDTTRED